MLNRSVGQYIDPVWAIDPDAYAAGVTNGAGIDTQGHESISFNWRASNFAAGGTLDGKIQESSDNSTFTDIASGTYTGQTASAITQLTAAGTAQINLDLPGKRKRYLRVVSTVGVNTVKCAVVAVLDPGQTVPVSGSASP